MVEYVGLDDTMKEMSSDESKVSINSCSSSACECPCRRIIVRQGWIGMLKVGYSN